MNPTLKKVIGCVIGVALLFVAYYGNYLPLHKSQTFIDTLQNLHSVSSIQEFESSLSYPIDLPSPIGTEELVRNAGNIALNLVQQNPQSSTVTEVVRFLESKYKPIIDYGKGMSYEQNLYLLGTINEVAFIKTHQPEFLQAADNYYAQGLALGPNRPQFLYGLFDIYRTEGNVQSSTAIAAKILSQWPDDQRTKDGLAQFMQYVASTTAAQNAKKK